MDTSLLMVVWPIIAFALGIVMGLLIARVRTAPGIQPDKRPVKLIPPQGGTGAGRPLYNPAPPPIGTSPPFDPALIIRVTKKDPPYDPRDDILGFPGGFVNKPR